MPPATMRYRRLDEARLLETLSTLRDRIEERFPGSGLARVAHELIGAAHEAIACVDYLRRPHWPVRAAVALVLLVVFAVVAVLAASLRLPPRVDGIVDLVQGIEAAINDLVFLGLAVFFLATVEGRLKRRRALRVLHELRSLAHIVDMHQLTKDPERLRFAQPDTASSPRRLMSPPQLGRYLDYCSELLSLDSKVAALLVQYFDDPVVLAGVDEVETLASGFSAKIWQKITLLDRPSRRELEAVPAGSSGGRGEAQGTGQPGPASPDG